MALRPLLRPISHFLLFKLALTCPISSADSCLNRVEMALRNKTWEVSDRRFKGEKLSVGDVVLPGVKDPVVIGFNPMGHAYLSIGGKRIDGGPFSPPHLSSNGVTNNGFLFVLNLTEEQRTAFTRSVQTDPLLKRTRFSCIHAVCSLLNEGAGIEVKDRSTWSGFSAPALYQELLEKGLFDKNSGTPVDITVIRLDNSSFSDVHRGFSFQQAAFGSVFGVLTVAGGLTITFVVATVVNSLTPPIYSKMTDAFVSDDEDGELYRNIKTVLDDHKYDEKILKWMHASEAEAQEFRKGGTRFRSSTQYRYFINTRWEYLSSHPDATYNEYVKDLQSRR